MISAYTVRRQHHIAELSSGNAFADLGFDNPEEKLLKAKLAREIRTIIKHRPADPGESH